MTRALICRPNGELEEIDLRTATPEEQALAIRDHRELELILILIRSIRTVQEAGRELE
ncbi:hypothetical protein [Stenotrophomonas maltophilia]|uniref:hypothetical protein n=1 Tax=Stenotrophomonas maltophilia TaxID=40324 RepID=UPI000B01FFA7|nr:hypothetical protein [Stenotrophomonas maltophilia]ELK2665298.1 hypothetical protein [Stenotrophomonas maltophilia]MBH1376161.1 hypothetical protein [Stenotrophomonas maltophilia]MBH1439158.1 hypothetical protein [Stenotrophomonas maltophilia]MBH1557898.1 hypothetical protein [Stenotrophomonas maltophilia]MBN4986047.1 hypothetical protein [Stenotrophomonas maltophilia]